jgi:ribonuclease VapC
VVIDSSALVAILLGEPEAERLTIALAADPMRCISALSVLETSIVLYRRKGPEAVAELDALVADLGIEIVAFDAIQMRAARIAYERFGKGLRTDLTAVVDVPTPE